VDESSRDGQLDVLELVVNGWIADRELVLELAVGGMDGGILAEDEACHHDDEGGEEQLVGVLALGSAGKELIEVVGIKDALQNGSGHDADGHHRGGCCGGCYIGAPNRRRQQTFGDLEIRNCAGKGGIRYGVLCRYAHETGF